MNRKICHAFAVALLAGILPWSMSGAWAQETGVKTTTEKISTEKNQPEKSAAPKAATDVPSKPKEIDLGINKTFYLSNASAPTDLQDVVNAIRTIVSIQRIQQIPSLGAIVVRGTAEQLVQAQKLIEDIDKPQRKFGGEYRLDFKISELEGEQKINSRTYTLLVEPHESAKLRLGTRVPLQADTEASSENKQLRFLDVGQNIDCQIRTESEYAVGVIVDVDFSNFGMSEQLKSEGRGNPVLQQFRITARTTLELGKPTIINRFDDPSSKRTFQMEVTATRVKQKA